MERAPKVPLAMRMTSVNGEQFLRFDHPKTGSVVLSTYPDGNYLNMETPPPPQTWLILFGVSFGTNREPTQKRNAISRRKRSRRSKRCGKPFQRRLVAGVAASEVQSTCTDLGVSLWMVGNHSSSFSHVLLTNQRVWWLVLDGIVDALIASEPTTCNHQNLDKIAANSTTCQ